VITGFKKGRALQTSTAAAALLMMAAPIAAYAQLASYTFNIPSQDLASALKAFGRVSRQQIVFDGAMVRGKASSALVGQFTVDQGLKTLLAGTGMTVTPIAGGVLAVRKADGAEPKSESHMKATADSASVSEVLVTATRVDRKGFTAPTPTTVLSQKDIQVGGRTNLLDVLDDLPQATGQFNSTNQTTSIIGGSSLAQLRDLGVNRTLVLIDGARPVPTEFQTSNMGFDLNMIPMDIVKRVDVVTGGASASWGSDAVAGVINIVMDDDFTGLKAGVQYGASTQGLGGDEYKIDVAGGANFANGRGHVMAAFEYNNREGIYASLENRVGCMVTVGRHETSVSIPLFD
jgi:outer membrane receptor protein involved in Fe transport